MFRVSIKASLNMHLLRFVRLCFMMLGAGHCLAHVIDIPPNCVVKVEEVTEVVEVEDIQVIVFNRQLEDITKVKYGQHLKLICDLYLPSPYSVLWRIPSKVLQGPRVDGKELDIPAVEYALHGEYIYCEVALLSNKTAPKNAIGTNLVIEDLARPKINMTAKVAALENENITITCKLLAGIPKPAISWKFKGFEDNIFRELSATGEELTINRTSLDNAGNYSCTAANAKGTVTKFTELEVQKGLTVAIEDGASKKIAYGSSPTLTCRVNGYPLSRIFWTDGNGKKIYSKVSTVNFHEKVSVLKLRGLKKSQNYSCHAEDTHSRVEESIDVTVLSPFVVHSHPDNNTSAHYGQARTIICNITSSFPMSIKWYKDANMSEIRSDKTYNICAGNTALSIMMMDMDAIGNYTCVASLLSDEMVNVAYTTDVKVDDLAPPQLSNSNKIVAMSENWITLYCKINTGVPPPKRSWLVKRHGDASYSELETTGEELEFPNITISDAGLYLCVVRNAVGESNMTTEVQVRTAPITTIAEGSSASVMFSSNVTITCSVVAYPRPSLQWTDGSGHVIVQNSNGTQILHELTTVNEHELVSKITVPGMKRDRQFHCYAINVFGTHQSTIDVNVRPAFVVHQTPDNTTNVHYTARRDLVCNITSELPMRIKWFYNSSEIRTTDIFTISANETVLSINSMLLDLEGSYKCGASLVSDENETVSFSTDVRIDDLVRPKIIADESSGTLLYVKNLEELTLTCKATGYPKPVISWEAKVPSTSNTKYLGTGESIATTNIGYNGAGTYVCIASNVAGVDYRIITLMVMAS